MILIRAEVELYSVGSTRAYRGLERYAEVYGRFPDLIAQHGALVVMSLIHAHAYDAARDRVERLLKRKDFDSFDALMQIVTFTERERRDLRVLPGGSSISGEIDRFLGYLQDRLRELR